MLDLSIKHHRLSEPLSGEVQQAGSAELPPTARPDASSARDVFRLGLSLIVVGLGASLAVQPSQAAPLPDIVKEPAEIDLGATSFYDALGSVEPTFILIDYGVTALSNSINDGNGRPNPAFQNPQVNSFANIIESIR